MDTLLLQNAQMQQVVLQQLILNMLPGNTVLPSNRHLYNVENNRFRVFGLCFTKEMS